MSEDRRSEEFAAQRQMMLERQLKARGISDDAVLAAMAAVPREAFVPAASRFDAYEDRPLAIGNGQTISQPYMVAWMMEAARFAPEDRVLDVGVGSGYGAAVASRIVRWVYGIERHSALTEQAGARLAELRYENVTLRTGDGTQGWAEQAPFDVIMVAAAGQTVPQALIDQLAPGGRLIMPVGAVGGVQELRRLSRNRDGAVTEEYLGAVSFVPLVLETDRES